MSNPPAITKSTGGYNASDDTVSWTINGMIPGLPSRVILKAGIENSNGVDYDAQNYLMT